MAIPITSVSKRPEPFFDAPAALYVITSEEIRRSGARFLPEVLRMSPGLDVARIDANKWAISSRGFNDRFANKLLVLVDGRTVYTPAFSGVYWELQDVLLEDIDRIEVIRGPGATLWGANAVNGVINLTTKSAKDTQGLYVEGGGGNVDQGFEGVRYGGKMGQNAYFRVYEKYFNQSQSFDSTGNAADDWRIGRGGMRIDWDFSPSDLLVFQGDIYRGEAGAKEIITTAVSPYSRIATGDAHLQGGNALARWQHTFAEENQASVQFYYDRTKRDDLRYSEERDTFDLDYQHRFSLAERHEIVYGLGYRFSQDQIDGTPEFFFPDPSRGIHLASAFLQDQITLVPDHFKLTLGSKFEHNDFTGFEVQPGTRLLWTPHPQHTVWASVARAVRTPSRAENNVQADFATVPPTAPLVPPIVVRADGNPDFRSEDLLAYEIGYRVQPVKRLTFDLALFYNDYANLRTGEAESGSPILEPSPHILLPLKLQNRMHGETYGVEIVAHLNPVDNWKLTASYSYLQMQLHLDPESTDVISPTASGRSPNHQFQAHSLLNLAKNVQFDTALYYVDSLPSLHVPSYVRFDCRLGWSPVKNLQLSLVTQNLLDNHHPEFGTSADNFDVPTEVRRSFYIMAAWRF